MEAYGWIAGLPGFLITFVDDSCTEENPSSDHLMVTDPARISRHEN
jgi:hypothetical protein